MYRGKWPPPPNSAIIHNTNKYYNVKITVKSLHDIKVLKGNERGWTLISRRRFSKFKIDFSDWI